MVTSAEGAEDSKELAAAELDRLRITADDTVVGISASGRTPFAVGAVEHARAKGALTVGLACNPGSALAAAADHGIEVVVGPELLTASTRLKAGTAQKLVLNMLSTITMIRLGKTYGNLMVDLRASNEKLRARSRRIVALATGAGDAEIESALDGDRRGGQERDPRPARRGRRGHGVPRADRVPRPSPSGAAHRARLTAAGRCTAPGTRPQIRARRTREVTAVAVVRTTGPGPGRRPVGSSHAEPVTRCGRVRARRPPGTARRAGAGAPSPGPGAGRGAPGRRRPSSRRLRRPGPHRSAPPPGSPSRR